MADGTMDYSHHRDRDGLYDVLLNNKIGEAEQAVLAAISAAGNNLGQSDLQNALTIIQNLNRVSSDLSTAVERNGSDGRDTTNRTASDIRSELAQTDNRVNTNVMRESGDIRQGVERTSADIRLELAQAEGRLSTATDRNGTETRRLLSEGQATTHSTLEHRTAELRGIANTNAMASMLEVERLKSCLASQAAHDTASLHKSIAESKFELAKELAACCCEQKELTMREAQATRGLIEKLEIDRLREALEHSRRRNDWHDHNEAVRVNVHNSLSQFVSAGNTRPIATPPAQTQNS